MEFRDRHTDKREAATIRSLIRRALPGETEVLGGLYFLPASSNDSPPPPVWVAPAVIGQVASRCSLGLAFVSPSPLKERGTKGVRLLNNPIPLPRGRGASPLFEGAKPLQ